MATRSCVAIQDNEKYVLTYIHWDGYPEGVGKELEQSYNAPDQALRVCNTGYLSSLRLSLEESIKETLEIVGSEPMIPTILSTLQRAKNQASYWGCEYFYLFDSKCHKWHCTQLY